MKVMKLMEKEAKQIGKVLKAGNDVIVTFEHLKPTVLVDTKDMYKAQYKDKVGSYLFEIAKKEGKWVITSDGFECSRSSDIDYIKWNFESQLATYSPQVLN